MIFSVLAIFIVKIHATSKKDLIKSEIDCILHLEIKAMN